MTPLLRLKLLRILFISVAWGLVGAYISIFRYSALAAYEMAEISGFSLPLDMSLSVALPASGAMLIGFLQFFWLDRVLRRKSFGRALTIKTILYASIIFALMMVGSVVYNTRGFERSVLHPEAFAGILAYATGMEFSLMAVTWLLMSFFTFFLFQVADQFGPGGLMQLLSGRYHHARSEERLLMFMDMNGSTTIAERIGETRFYELVNEVIADFTDSILNHGAQIYRYIGDEVIVSWPMRTEADRRLARKRALHLPLHLKELLERKAVEYQKKFDVAPTFKFGLHSGEIVIGEIGVIKNEITFAGDAVNACARILELCGKLERSILISELALRRLGRHPEEGPTTVRLSLEDLGEHELRGKDARVRIFSLERARSAGAVDSQTTEAA